MRAFSQTSERSGQTSERLGQTFHRFGQTSHRLGQTSHRFGPGSGGQKLSCICVDQRQAKPLIGQDKPLIGSDRPLIGQDKPLIGSDKPLRGLGPTYHRFGLTSLEFRNGGQGRYFLTKRSQHRTYQDMYVYRCTYMLTKCTYRCVSHSKNHTAHKKQTYTFVWNDIPKLLYTQI